MGHDHIRKQQIGQKKQIYLRYICKNICFFDGKNYYRVKRRRTKAQRTIEIPTISEAVQKNKKEKVLARDLLLNMSAARNEAFAK